MSIGRQAEMVLRGGFRAGYWRVAEETQQTLQGGWPHTGTWTSRTWKATYACLADGAKNSLRR